MENTKVPANPFDKIALGCSGGGYRAAAFHLGSMAYLHTLRYRGKPLLENVRLISTVSGGTITGIVYALMKQKNKSFEEIYSFLLNSLKSLDLLKEGITKLNPDAVWKNQEKHKNLINAFSELYDSYLTRGAVLGDLHPAKAHLEAVIFNSTEFNNAIDFRFKNKDAGYSGNYMVRMTDRATAEIKLADIMAASSCFPGGFEPIIWPDDFVYEKSKSIRAEMAKGKPSVGLMDGGIYDNQGIEAILNYKKDQETPYFDLIIISDVASPYMDAYQPFKEEPKKGFNKWTVKEIIAKALVISKRINWWITGIAFFFLIIPAIWCYPDNIWTGLSLAIGAMGIAILIGKYYLLKWLKTEASVQLEKALSLIPPFYREKLSNLKIDDLSVHRLQPLIVDRLKSLLTLLLSVFLKIVRRLNYEKIYRNDDFKYRRVSNLIKGLTQVDFENNAKRRKADGPVDPELAKHSVLLGTYSNSVGTAIQTMAETAAKFGTTLWFTEADQLEGMLDHLLATGKVTMCYNLLSYLEKVIYEKDSGFEELDDEVKNQVKLTFKQCKTDWEIFKKSPFNSILPVGKIKTVVPPKPPIVKKAK